MKYYPKRSWSTKALLAFNSVAYVTFVIGAIYLSQIIVRQAIVTPSTEHLIILIFPAAFAIAIFYWGSGALDLLTSHFRVSISAGTLYFDYIGHPFSKQKRIRLDEITEIDIAGNPERGVWITLRTKRGRQHLGHLLDLNDAARIIETIRNETEPNQ